LRPSADARSRAFQGRFCWRWRAWRSPGAASAAISAHGQLLNLAPNPSLNANQSTNWFGYNQGALE
jgi:hypothetical protein